MSQEAQSFFQQATQALQAGQAENALGLIDQAIAIESRSEFLVVRGICLAQIGRTSEATETFQRSIAADPNNAKAYYNFATHLYQLGRKQEALAYAQQAVAKDPAHTSAAELVRLIQSEQAPPPAAPQEQSQAGSPYGGPPSFAQYPREAPPTPFADGAIPFVRNMGKTWVIIGWVLVVISLVVYAYSLFQLAPFLTQMFEVMSKNQGDMETLTKDMQSKYPQWLSVLGYLLQGAALIWTILDVIDRRANYLWLILLIPCTCCGLQFMAMPLYLALGRNTRT